MSEHSEISHPSQVDLLLRYLQRERDNLIGTLDGAQRLRRAPADDPERHQPARAGQARRRPSSSATSASASGGPGPSRSRGTTRRRYEARRGHVRRWPTSRARCCSTSTARSWAFADQNIRELGLDAPAHGARGGAEERRETTVGYLAGAHARRDRPPRRATPTSCARRSTGAVGATTTRSATRSTGRRSWRRSRRPRRTADSAAEQPGAAPPCGDAAALSCSRSVSTWSARSTA